MWIDEHCLRRRGYGIHSPMLYRIVREAMMPRYIIGPDKELYRALRDRHIGHRTATKLQNLFTTEHYAEWQVDDFAGERGLTILTHSCTEEKLGEIVGKLSGCEGVVCATYPLWGFKRLSLCRELAHRHHSMSAEMPRMMLFFSRHDLRKQHIKF